MTRLAGVVQPGRRAEREPAVRSAAPGLLHLAFCGLILLLLEVALHQLYPHGGHLLAQRRSEVYGGLSLTALLLVLASRWLRLVPLRRTLGRFAFATAVIHSHQAFRDVLHSDVQAVLFLSPSHQAAVWLGVVALLGLLPLAVTSSNAAVRRLGKRWKTLHRLGPPMTLLAVLHTVLLGVHFGVSPLAWASLALGLGTGAVFALRRSRRFPRLQVNI